MNVAPEATQLDMFGPINGMPDPPWPPALICEAYGTAAGNWRIRCSLPGHEPEFGLWGGTKKKAQDNERDHRLWHERRDNPPVRCAECCDEGPGDCYCIRYPDDEAEA